MIDFEQLKIENQTYNEKIEERKEASSLCQGLGEASVEVGLGGLAYSERGANRPGLPRTSCNRDLLSRVSGETVP